MGPAGTDEDNGLEPLGAIVMANGEADDLARQQGAGHKALLDIAGEPMVWRVVEALQASEYLAQPIVACRQGGPVAQALRDRVELAEATGGTILDGIRCGFERLSGISRAIVVTCDTPLVTGESLDEFARQVRANPQADLVYAMVEVERTRAAFPESHRTAIRLIEGNYTAAGMACLSRRFVDHCGPKLMQAFGARKSKFAMGRMFGFGFLLRFALGKLSVVDLVRRAEQMLDCRAAAVNLPFAECGFDVDDEGDLEAARLAWGRRGQ
jgi:molybdopterin-guanine dinucleotide biosynthesis protein A